MYMELATPPSPPSKKKKKRKIPFQKTTEAYKSYIIYVLEVKNCFLFFFKFTYKLNAKQKDNSPFSRPDCFFLN